MYQKQNFAHSQGARPKMKDFVQIIKDDPFMIFATFDGQSGIEAASYAKEHLYSNINRNGLLSQNDDQVKGAISDGFRKTQEEM